MQLWEPASCPAPIAGLSSRVCSVVSGCRYAIEGCTEDAPCLSPAIEACDQALETDWVVSCIHGLLRAVITEA